MAPAAVEPVPEPAVAAEEAVAVAPSEQVAERAAVVAVVESFSRTQ